MRGCALPYIFHITTARSDCDRCSVTGSIPARSGQRNCSRGGLLLLLQGLGVGGRSGGETPLAVLQLGSHKLVMFQAVLS